MHLYVYASSTSVFVYLRILHDNRRSPDVFLCEEHKVDARVLGIGSVPGKAWIRPALKILKQHRETTFNSLFRG